MTREWGARMTILSPVAALFSLVCCAMPIALVTLGLGSVVASLVSSAPWLVELSRHKAWVFLAAGAVLVGNYLFLYRGPAACDPGDACHATRPLGRWLRRLYWGSVGVFLLGLAAAYLSVPLVNLLDRV